MALAVASGGAASASAASATFRPVADTHASAARPAENFGEAGTMAVARRPAANAYLRFRVAGLDGPVVAARLRLRSLRRATPRILVRRLRASPTGPWSERSVTWRRAPALGEVAGAPASSRRSAWTVVDVSGLVTGAGIVELGLSAQRGAGTVFATRERGRLSPRLVVMTNPFAPAPLAPPGPGSPAAPAPASGPAPAPAPTEAPAPTPTPTPSATPTPAPTATPAPTPASPARTHLAGAHVHALWSSMTVAEIDRELDAAKAGGMDTVRVDLGWSALEIAGKGQFNQAYVDKADTFFAHAQARGLKVITVFWTTPCWASSAPSDVKQDCAGAWWERGVERYPPARPADFADAAAWVARRWGGQMHALEVWNEPNHTQFLKGPDPAASYAGMLKAAYPSLKAARPGLTVLGGSLVYSDGDFLRDLYDRLAIKGSHDGIAYHPYSEGRDPDDVTAPVDRKYSYRLGTEWMREIMVAHGESALGLWITETGFPTCTAGAHGWCVSPEKQAEYTVDNHRIAREWPFVKAVITYNLRNKGTNPDSFEDQMGLLRRDLTPKPAYDALRAELGR